MLTLRSARLLASAIWSGCPLLGEGYCVLSLGVRVLGMRLFVRICPVGCVCASCGLRGCLPALVLLGVPSQLPAGVLV